MAEGLKAPVCKTGYRRFESGSDLMLKGFNRLSNVSSYRCIAFPLYSLSVLCWIIKYIKGISNYNFLGWHGEKISSVRDRRCLIYPNVGYGKSMIQICLE